MSVRTDTVLATIKAAIDGLNLPAPTAYRVDDTSIRLGFRTPADVDRWAQHIGMPPGRTHHGQHAAVDFWPAGGWCGAEAITLAAPATQAAEVTT